jgi:hypothetical protein
MAKHAIIAPCPGKSRFESPHLWLKDLPMITETAVHHLSATELLDLYRRKALSPSR